MIFTEFSLSAKHLLGLKSHKYSTSTNSLLDNTLLLPAFWDSCQRLLPRTLAPNTVTLAGFIVDVIGFLPLVLFSLDLTTARPPWMLLLSALCMFVYNTADNIDGRHARALGCGSVIGEIFDHGLDSMTNSLQILPLMIAGHSGRVPFIASFVTFLVMETYVVLFFTRKLTLGSLQFNFIDTTELQYLAIFAVGMTGCLGMQDPELMTAFWSWKLPAINISLRTFYFLLGTFPLTVNLVYQLSNQMRSPMSHRIQYELFNCFVIWLLASTIFLAIPESREKPIMYFIMIAGVFSKLITESIFSNVGAQYDKPLVNCSLLAPVFVIWNAYFKWVGADTAIFAGAFYAVAIWVLYFSTIILRSARFLHVSIFTVPKIDDQNY